jgi:TolB-like protein
VRVGIHVGEVTEHAEASSGGGTPRVEGLAVDLAARIAGLARPGQVLLSAAVAASAQQRMRHAVGGRAIRFESHGLHALKGSTTPLEIFEVGLEGIAEFSAPQAGEKARPVAPPRRIPLAAMGAVGLLLCVAALGYFAFRSRSTPELAPIRAIAVLPLENLSGDPEHEYFADGMTDAMIGELAKISALKVISRTSVMQYKGAHRPLPEIARELGVDAIIEGTVLRAGEHVRITAQLIDARDDHHLWAQSYERELSAVLQIQSEVARAVAGRIEAALAPREAARLAAPKPVDARAQDAYLKGVHRLGLRNPVAAKQAIIDFEEAIRIAPDYAPAHAALSQANFFLGFPATAVMDRAAMERARASALRAVELDSDLAAAHAALAQVFYSLDWNWAEATDLARRMNLPVPEDAVTR